MRDAEHSGGHSSELYDLLLDREERARAAPRLYLVRPDKGTGYTGTRSGSRRCAPVRPST